MIYPKICSSQGIKTTVINSIVINKIVIYKSISKYISESGLLTIDGVSLLILVKIPVQLGFQQH